MHNHAQEGFKEIRPHKWGRNRVNATPKGTSVYGNKSCDKLIVIIDPCGMDAINIKRKVD